MLYIELIVIGIFQMSNSKNFNLTPPKFRYEVQTEDGGLTHFDVFTREADLTDYIDKEAGELRDDSTIIIKKRRNT